MIAVAAVVDGADTWSATALFVAGVRNMAGRDNDDLERILQHVVRIEMRGPAISLWAG